MLAQHCDGHEVSQRIAHSKGQTVDGDSKKFGKYGLRQQCCGHAARQFDKQIFGQELGGGKDNLQQNLGQDCMQFELQFNGQNRCCVDIDCCEGFSEKQQ